MRHIGQRRIPEDGSGTNQAESPGALRIPGGRRSCSTFASSARNLRRGGYRCFADLSGLRRLPRGPHCTRSTIVWPTKVPHSISLAHCSRCMAMEECGRDVARGPIRRRQREHPECVRVDRRRRRTERDYFKTSKPLCFRVVVSVAHYTDGGLRQAFRRPRTAPSSFSSWSLSAYRAPQAKRSPKLNRTG